MNKKSERKIYHVTHTSDKGWKVKKEGASRVSDYFGKKSDAVGRGGNPGQNGYQNHRNKSNPLSPV